MTTKQMILKLRRDLFDLKEQREVSKDGFEIDAIDMRIDDIYDELSDLENGFSEYPETTTDDADWKHEQAIQNGMVFGCAGYNDTYGW